jgi:hypothetical protein
LVFLAFSSHFVPPYTTAPQLPPWFTQTYGHFDEQGQFSSSRRLKWLLRSHKTIPTLNFRRVAAISDGQLALHTHETAALMTQQRFRSIRQAGLAGDLFASVALLTTWLWDGDSVKTRRLIRDSMGDAARWEAIVDADFRSGLAMSDVASSPLLPVRPDGSMRRVK